jgi:serine/threonine-protein kinase HipA
MSARHGSVWFEATRVGNIVEGEHGRIRFTYAAEWLEEGFSISLSVPLSSDEMDAHAFFAGLLPEGLARQRICRQYRLRDDDDLGLLLAIGRDCAGALAVFPEDAEPRAEELSVPITQDDLTRLVESRGQALPAAAEGPRFSLAGAQDKLAVRIDENGMWLPTWRRPSSHILKFETIRWVCFAEYAANEMASRLGLPVVTETYHWDAAVPPAPYLQVARYDRQQDAAGSLRRLHQEDMTQAMGLTSAFKYEDDGGPSLGEVANLVRRHSADPVADIATLRDWQLFNYLIGNSDGHAKNLALLYHPSPVVPRLAPLYDLVCIEFLNRLGLHYNRRLAFFIGGNNLPEQVSRQDWAEHAKAMGVPAKSLLERLAQMAQELPSLAAATRASFAERFGDNQAYGRLEESVADRCGWTIRSVFGKG